jgi:hypothetical protein
MFTVDVWDKRDRNSDEPGSQLGVFETLEQARKALADYLAGEHGPYIEGSSITQNEGRDFWEWISYVDEFGNRK